MTKESFEQALAELEEVVGKLEDEGVERRVEQLLAEAAEGEEPKTAPFTPEEG